MQIQTSALRGLYQNKQRRGNVRSIQNFDQLGIIGKMNYLTPDRTTPEKTMNLIEKKKIFVPLRKQLPRDEPNSPLL